MITCFSDLGFNRVSATSSWQFTEAIKRAWVDWNFISLSRVLPGISFQMLGSQLGNFKLTFCDVLWRLIMALLWSWLILCKHDLLTIPATLSLIWDQVKLTIVIYDITPTFLGLSWGDLVASLNSSFFPPHVGAEPGRSKRRVQDDLPCACSERRHFFLPNRGKKTFLETLFRSGL